MSESYDRIMDERRKLVEMIIDNMNKGYVLPKPDWGPNAFLDTRIRNPVSGARYRGANLLRLYLTSLEQGYTDGRWMTYKQAQSEGWQVKKGEKGVRCEKYIFTRQVEEKNLDTGEMERKTIPLSKPMVNTFVVFNARQIDGIPELENEMLEPLKPDEILEMAELFQESSACPIRETTEGKAYYTPGRDEIVLPVRNAFLDTQSFLATQLHEMVHSTGHPDRLNRPLTGSFGSPKYAMEELRAELGSFFIQNDLSLHFDAQHLNSHTQYLESWIKALKEDPNELFRAIADAQKACDFLEERYELLKEQKLAEEQTQFLIEQQEAAVRMAVKHEAKQSGSGEPYLERWIEKDVLKRKELKIPIHLEEMDYMRESYKEAVQSLDRSGLSYYVQPSASEDRIDVMRDFDSALERYTDIRADGKVLGITIDGVNIPLANFSTSDFRNHMFPDIDVHMAVLQSAGEQMGELQPVEIDLMKHYRGELQPVYEKMISNLEYDNQFQRMSEVFEQTRFEANTAMRKQHSLSGTWCSVVALLGMPETYVRYEITGAPKRSEVIFKAEVIKEDQLVNSQSYSTTILEGDSGYLGVLKYNPEFEKNIREQFQPLWNGKKVIAYAEFYQRNLEEHKKQIEERRLIRRLVENKERKSRHRKVCR